MTSPLRDEVASGATPTLLGYTTHDDGEVCYQGLPLTLAPKERAALHLLLRHWPRVVPKTCFAEQVWAGQAMSDESLARCMAQLRHALGSNGQLQPQAVYGRGYRLRLGKHSAAPTAPNGGAPATHWRLMHAALASPERVEALTHARQLVQQRTEPAIIRAEVLLRSLLEQAPGYPAARLAFAECVAASLSGGLTVRRERIDEALAQLALAAQESPSMPGLATENAHLLDNAWRFKEAAALHAQALVQAPDDATTHYYHGWHLLATGQARPAVEALRSAVRLNPFAVHMAILLARAHITAGDLPAALACARRIQEQAPDHPGAAVYLLACEALVDPRPALIKEARRMLPGPGAWVFAASSLAFVLARCGATQEALRLVRASAHTSASARATHASVLCMLGQTDEAFERLEQAAAEGCGMLPVLLLAAENTALREDARYAGLRTRIWGQGIGPQ